MRTKVEVRGGERKEGNNINNQKLQRPYRTQLDLSLTQTLALLCFALSYTIYLDSAALNTN